jgi:hypothetical protein
VIKRPNYKDLVIKDEPINDRGRIKFVKGIIRFCICSPFFGDFSVEYPRLLRLLDKLIIKHNIKIADSYSLRVFLKRVLKWRIFKGKLKRWLRVGVRKAYKEIYKYFKDLKENGQSHIAQKLLSRAFREYNFTEKQKRKLIEVI